MRVALSLVGLGILLTFLATFFGGTRIYAESHPLQLPLMLAGGALMLLGGLKILRQVVYHRFGI